MQMMPLVLRNIPNSDIYSYYPLALGDCDITKYDSVFLYNSDAGVYMEILPENYVL